MSLFPSSFETGITASASTSSPSSSKKRKHSAAGSGGSRADQLRATQVNLDKLIAKVERGEVRERAGHERMGAGVGEGGGKRHKGKGRVEDEESRVREGKGYGRGGDKGSDRRDGDKADRRGDDGHGRGDRPKFDNQRNQRDRDQRDQRQGGKPAQHGSHSSPAQSKFKSPKSPNTSHAHNKTERPSTSNLEKPSFKSASSSSTSRPAPAELPLPHNFGGSGSKSPAGGSAALTDMQKGMQAKLEGARFRWINEQLYSIPSTEAVAMMQRDPKIFADYHHTHRALTSAWPSPPLPLIVDRLSALARRTVIVDLGCGDAGLARALVPRGFIVLSFDLVGDSGITHALKGESGEDSDGSTQTKGGWVVEADFLTHVPLPGRPGGDTDASAQDQDEAIPEPEIGKAGKNAKSKGKQSAKKHANPAASEVVDVVVCCLSLMGVNWLGGIYEACRVLRKGGQLHIAEVTSRFVSTDDFVTAVESFGFHLNKQEEPSTHFTLFEFTKTVEVPVGPVPSKPGWTARVAEGEQILRGCVYKKR